MLNFYLKIIPKNFGEKSVLFFHFVLKKHSIQIKTFVNRSRRFTRRCSIVKNSMLTLSPNWTLFGTSRHSVRNASHKNDVSSLWKRFSDCYSYGKSHRTRLETKNSGVKFVLRVFFFKTNERKSIDLEFGSVRFVENWPMKKIHWRILNKIFSNTSDDIELDNFNSGRKLSTNTISVK